MTKSRAALVVGAAILVAALLPASAAIAATTESYNFNTAGDLTTGFAGYVDAGTVVQALTGGLSNTGAIHAPGSADAVFTSQAGYSMGPVGSTYTFSSFLQSIGNSGYSGMGFTSLTASSATAGGSPYRPTDALGISVHGGGFVFHNGGTDYHGSWDSPVNAGITTVTAASIFDLLNNGSPDDWYRVVLVITRDTATTFDMRVEVWPSTSAGVLLDSSAAAIFELNDSTNASISGAPIIHSYINFSGDRVRYFDDYNVDLAGGASVIAPGAPVVLTSSAVASGSALDLDGEVTDPGDDPVTARGFAYGTSAAPTVAGTVVAAGAGAGAFSASTPALATGTYYVRAFATSATGTSYGSEFAVAVVGAAVPAASLADTGLSTPMLITLGIVGAVAVLSGAALMIVRRRQAQSA